MRAFLLALAISVGMVGCGSGSGKFQNAYIDHVLTYSDDVHACATG